MDVAGVKLQQNLHVTRVNFVEKLRRDPQWKIYAACGVSLGQEEEITLVKMP